MRSVCIVIPVFNEAPHIQEVCRELLEAVSNIPHCSVLFVNDASTDRTGEILEEIEDASTLHLAKNTKRRGLLTHARMHSTAEVFVVMDSDGQDNPHDIEILLRAIEESSVCMGYRQSRKSRGCKPFISRAINILCNMVLPGSFHDTNASLKAVRREVLEALPLYGRLDRYLPHMAVAAGFSVSEIPVHHRVSKRKYSYFGFCNRLSALKDLFVAWRWCRSQA